VSTAISADSHMDLMFVPPDTFTTRMPRHYADRIPHVVEREGRKIWLSGNDRLGAHGSYGGGVAGGKRGRVLAEAGLNSGPTRPSDASLRMQDQERDGVAAEIIYGITGVSKRVFDKDAIEDPDLLADIYRAYNRYIAEFNRSAPGRFFGLGCIVNHDARVAADMARECAELGLRGVIFIPWGAAMPVWHSMWEPLWSEAEECGLVVSFHAFEGGRTTVGYEYRGNPSAVIIGSWTVVAPMHIDEVLVSLILSGVCERHPRLRFVLGEAGIGWIPYVLERLDDTYQERLAEDLQLSLLPSEYFRRQIYSTFQKDIHGVRAMAEIAPDNVMWGSDYPHRDGTFPFSAEALDTQFRGIDASIRRKMTWENVRRVYGIEEGAS
jgi:predicted TIM-barrel fold metal-dependent hydrolase